MNVRELPDDTIHGIDDGYLSLWIMRRGWKKETPEEWARVIDAANAMLRAAGAK